MDWEKAKLRWSTAKEIRQFEIDLYWKRALFFWGFIAAAAIAFFSAKDKVPLAALPVASFGLVCSFAWTLANRGSKYWQENWEQKVNRFEIDITGPLIQSQEPVIAKGFWGAKKFSVSRLTIGLSDLMVGLWVVALSNETILSISPQSAWTRIPPCISVVVALSTLGYMLVLFLFARTQRQYDTVRQSPLSSQDDDLTSESTREPSSGRFDSATTGSE